MAVHGIMEASVDRAQRRREQREGQEAGFEAGEWGPVYRRARGGVAGQVAIRRVILEGPA